MATPDPTEEPTVRTGRYQASEPLDIDVVISAGTVTVQLTAAPDDQPSPTTSEATVELRHDPSAQPPWPAGMNAMLNLFGGDWRASPADAVAETRIDQSGGRLVIQAASALPLRNVPLAVTVHAPAGSDLTIKTSTADVTVTGKAGRADVSTGSGDVALDGTNVSCRARTGSGAVWFGEVDGDVFARTGSGSIAVAAARSGTVELNTGSGDLRIGIGNGVTGEIDVSSGAGRVISELDVVTEEPSERAGLTAHARTGTGNAVLRRSGF